MQCPELRELREEIPQRIKRFRALMVAEGIEVALVLQKVDLFYLSGTAQDGILQVDHEGERLFVKRYPQRAAEESPLPVVPIISLKDLRKFLGPFEGTIGLELDVLPVRLFEQLKEIFPKAEFKDVSPLILRLRSSKSPWELSMIKKASEIYGMVLKRALEILRPGISELELSGELIKTAMSHGHQEYLRMRGFNQEAHSWHVLSGQSASILSSLEAPLGGWGPSPAYPMGAGKKRVKPGEVVLLDFGTCYFGYHSDHTRCLCLGRPPDPLKKAHEVCIEVVRTLEQRAIPGVLCSELYEATIKVVENRGFGKNFMGLYPFQARFVGHGIGLEISEPPFLAQGHDYPLEEGEVIALEPKMVFEGLGAVGLETTYLVTKEGLKPLVELPEEILEL